MASTPVVALSTMADGSMSKAVNDEQRRANRQEFLAKNGITLEQSVLVHLAYEGDDYRRYYEVTSEQAGDGMTIPSSITSDALFTRSKYLALFLPIADCIGAVLHDPYNEVLGVAHLGRHNLEQSGGGSIVGFMKTEFGTDPANVSVWLSPAAGRKRYPLYDFSNRSLHEVALEQLLGAGIDSRNIIVDNRDTTTDASLFSHSQFLKGNRSSDGRQAVVAMMRP